MDTLQPQRINETLPTPLSNSGDEQAEQKVSHILQAFGLSGRLHEQTDDDNPGFVLGYN